MKRAVGQSVLFELFCTCIREQWQMPALLVAGSLALEVVSVQIMTILSSIYKAVSAGDTALFYKTLLVALVVVTLISLIKSLVSYATESCALTWRRHITEAIHASSYISHPAGILMDASVASLGTVDQRITQDADRLTSQAAKLLADTVALPAVIVFYSVHLIYLFNWSVVVACFAYFLCGCAVSSLLAGPLVPAVYRQEALEGGFRAAHSRYQQRLPDIRLLRGEAAERQNLGAAFAALVANTQSLIRKRLALSAFTNWFAYTGSLVNYLVVGGVILHLSASSDSQADLASRLAEGSYACLYVVNALSVLIASSKSVGELAGLAQRVEELLQRVVAPAAARLGETSGHKGLHDRNNFKHAFSAVRAGLFDDDAADSSASLLPHSDAAVWGWGGIELGRSAASPLPSSPAPPTLGDAAPTGSEGGALLVIRDLDLRADAIEPASAVLPRLLVARLSLAVTAGMRLLVTGPSGCGKSTLVRRISAALRNTEVVGAQDLDLRDLCCKISLHVPLDALVICPQTPYLVKGTLRENLVYPHSGATAAADPAQLQDALRRAGLEHLCGHIAARGGGEPVLDWDVVASAGEKQRIAVARALLRAPSLAVFDEVTSALDEESEAAVYQAICAACPTFISVGHRSTIRRFHTHELRLHGDASYSLLPLPSAS